MITQEPIHSTVALGLVPRPWGTQKDGGALGGGLNPVWYVPEPMKGPGYCVVWVITQNQLRLGDTGLSAR